MDSLSYLIIMASASTLAFICIRSDLIRYLEGLDL